MSEVYFVVFYFQENKFQVSGGVNCSVATDCCQINVQSKFNDFWENLRKIKEKWAREVVERLGHWV